MRRIASTVAVVLALVAVPFGVFLGARAGSSGSAGAERRHFFLVGERECAHTLGKLPQAGTGSGFRFGFLVSDRYPRAYRAAVEAGCKAAVKRWPLLGYGSPPPS
jgi:hypothetical protein